MSSTIDAIDKNLGKYYKRFGRTDYFNSDKIGKFKLFTDECGFEDEGVTDELEQDYEDCTILEFDCDEDDHNIFPLEESISDSDERNQEIHRILGHIAKYGTPNSTSAMELNLNICNDITDNEKKMSTAKYASQITTIDTAENKDSVLKHYFAVGLKQKYPFLMYMVDAFTTAKVQHFIKSGKDTLTVLEWVKKNKFYIALKKKYSDRGDQLQAAIVSYSARVMSRLQFEPTYKVNDNLKQISEYITSVTTFITNMLNEETSGATPPFQIDLIIAVQDVIAQFGAEDGSEDEEEEGTDPQVDHIGDVEAAFKQQKLCYVIGTDGCVEEKQEMSDTRRIGVRYNEFRTVLCGESSDQKSNAFDAETYPNGRRFSIFVDRRKSESSKSDTIAIFEPPNGCNSLGNDSVPEIGFEFVKQCLLPNVESNITANDSVCGQLMSFMFSVEAKDEIRCYFIYNSQTMRFNGDYMSQILPSLFVDTKANQIFVANKEGRKYGGTFDQNVNDRKFEGFHQALSNFA